MSQSEEEKRPINMAGGDAPKPSANAASHHRQSGWEASSSSAAALKSKPSPKTAATPPTNKDSINMPQLAHPKPRFDNPSPRPEIPNSMAGPSSIFPFNDHPPTPTYGFHMLHRRSIALADGSMRSYFALPPDYEKVAHMQLPAFRPGFAGHSDFGIGRPPFPMSPEFRGPEARIRNAEFRNVGLDHSLKRKFGEEERGGRDDGFDRQRQQLLQYGNVNGPGPSVVYDLPRGEEMRAAKAIRINEGNSSKLRHSEVDQNELKKAFLHFVKLIFETANRRKSFLADGKQGPLPCLACGRSSKDFPDTHSLIMHAYNSENAGSLVDHLAFHKALCILMGWNYLMPPNNSKTYQNLSAGGAEANVDDLILWPPTVLIHNTITGKGKDGRMEGLGNRAMDSVLRDLGFSSGKSMSLYAREGHLGMHAVKFSGDEAGLKEAQRLADYFERQKHGRKDWSHVQTLTAGKDDDKNPNLVRLDPKTGEKNRVFYGHLATAADLDKITFELKKKVSVMSIREFMQPK